MPPTAPSRRRNEELLSAIHEATLAELAERGFSGVTFEGVARRARTSKPVLYRRYPSRAELVLAAVHAREPLPVLDAPTGELRADLLSLFSAHEARYHRLGAGVIRGLLAELPQERANETLAAGSILTHTTLRALVAQARADGKLGPREVPDAVLDTPIALLRHEFLMLGRVPSRAQVEEILDLIYLPLLRLHSGAAAPSGR